MYIVDCGVLCGYTYNNKNIEDGEPYLKGIKMYCADVTCKKQKSENLLDDIHCVIDSASVIRDVHI